MHMRMDRRESGIVYRKARQRPSAEVLRMELLRKSIHLLVVLVPSMAAMDRDITIAILGAGVASYVLFESLRQSGREVPLVSRLTVLSARKRDEGKFIMGPVTLGTGALLSILLFPPQAAAVAIYALGFGDGLSSLVGRFFGGTELPLTRGKSLEGSFTCFVAVFASAIAVTGKPLSCLPVAVIATIVEAIPAKDYDNIVLPLATGLVSLIFL